MGNSSATTSSTSSTTANSITYRDRHVLTSPLQTSVSSSASDHTFIKYAGSTNYNGKTPYVFESPGSEKGNIKHSSTAQHYPPLKLCKDAASQTTVTYNSTSDRWKNNLFTSLGINFKDFVITLFALYAAICVLLIISPYLQSLIVYLNVVRYPLGELTDLRRFGITTRNINIITEDGVSLKGWHLIPPLEDIHNNILCSHLSLESQADECFDTLLSSSHRVILYFHGNGATRALAPRITIVKQMAQLLQAHVISFDYRGFGDSEGWPSEYGTHLDAKAVFHWVNDRFLSRNISFANNSPNINSRNRPYLYIYGHSLGTGIGSGLVAEANRFQPPPIDGLILDAAFTSLVEATMTHPLGAPFRIFTVIKKLLRHNLAYRYMSIDRIHRLRSHLLLLHGSNDFKIPIENSEMLYIRALSNPANCPLDIHIKQQNDSSGKDNCYKVALQSVDGAGHNNVHVYAEWLDALTRFINAAESSQY